jgi:acetoin utilization deacetylase AcuC-like enzyme
LLDQSDTPTEPRSFATALLGVGAGLQCCDAVMSGKVKRAFAAVRPPGHHAEPDRGMGFCLFANISIAASYLQQAHGVGKIAIVDFDVHHGNGTQAVAWDDADFFFGSSHQYPFYPGTGGTGETGIAGQIVNAPLAARSGRAAFEAAWTGRILPALDAFAPDCLIVSAGFDAHRDDPLAQLELEEADFAWITGEIMAAATRHTEGRIVSLLEGGYDLDALAASTAAHVRRLLAN